MRMAQRLRKRVGVLAYRRRVFFRHDDNHQNVSTVLMMLCRRRYADTPRRRYVSPGLPYPPALITLAAGLFVITVYARERVVNLAPHDPRILKNGQSFRGIK
jgi:hypothetical protein